MTTATEVRPPLSNRGAKWPPEILTWDWYQATLDRPSEMFLLLNGLSRAFGGGEWDSCAALYGYSVGYRLRGVAAGSVQVFVRDTDVHVQASSSAAITAAGYLRRAWPEHRVSRADVALDIDVHGSFDRLWREVHGLAREVRGRGRRVTTSTAGDWIDNEQGRTFYAGGVKSRLRVVVYEKGLEQLGKDPDCGASRDWTRVEWRVRPDTPEMKTWLATATPAQAVGLTKFGADVATALMSSEVTTPDAARRFASQDPLYWMVRQYRRSVEEILAMDPLDAMRLLADTLDRATGSPL